MKEKKEFQWKAYLGSGLVLTGSAMAGWGFGSKNGKTVTLGTFLMGIGTLFVVDHHSDVINHNTKVTNKILDDLNDRIVDLENK